MDVAPMTLTEYGRYCGPGAFHAVGGVPRETAARVLRGVADRLGERAEPGTSRRVLATALSEAGMRLELWSTTPHGWRLGHPLDVMDAERCQIEALRAAVQAAELSPRPSQPEVPAAIRDALSLAAQVAREREARRRNAARPLTVDEWLARRPVACWVLRVDEPMPHWLVARRGFVVAGDLPECGSARVVEAWRCFPLSGVWRGKISRG